MVAARRAQDLGLVSWEAFSGFRQSELERWNRSRSVVTQALQREILWRDAARLLGIQPSQIERLAVELGIQ